MKLVIASGKGGTGKTTVATNLAVTLAEMGEQVQVLDCDVEEPNAHLFLQPLGTADQTVESLIPLIDPDRCTLCGICVDICAYNALATAGDQVLFFPEMCHGCGGCVRLCPEGAIQEVERSIGTVLRSQIDGLELVWGRLHVGLPLAPAVIAEVKKTAQPEATVIIDASPGTSCAAVAAITDCNLCLLVTEPTAFGLHDLKRAAEMTRELDSPAAVIINRSDIGDRQAHTYCQENSLPILLEIPFSRRLAECYARGKLWVDEFPEWKDTLTHLWGQVKEYAHERAIGH
jgi:MinD superfamily P-loop ATPase